LHILQNSDGAPHFHFERTYRRVNLGVIVVGAVTEIEPKRIDASEKQLLEHRRRSAGWSDGGNDLGSTVTSHVQISLSAASGDQDRANIVDVRHRRAGMDQVSDLSHSVLELLQLRLGLNS
jgi:hypothetical protein